MVDSINLDFSGAEVLITGGLGFIGSHLARKIVQSGGRVTIVDSLIPEYGGNLFNVRDITNNIAINISDVRDPYSIRYLVKNKSHIFNLAGQTSHLDSMTDPLTDLRINAEAQLSILEACRKENPSARVVFASTRQVYGRPNYLPVDENHLISPVDVNGINKLAGEMYHTLYSKTYGMRTTVLRLTNTYGPAMRIKDARQTFLGIWIRNLIEGKPIKVFGTGMQLRDFNYVSDVVHALCLVAENENTVGEVFNLGGFERVSLLELADTMIAINGSGEREVIPFPAERSLIDIGDYYSEFRKISDRISWLPSVSLSDGLQMSLEYFKEHWRQYCDVLDHQGN